MIEDDEWVIDSGATRHFCPNREMFSDFQSISPTKVVLGNKSAVPAIGRGSIKFRTRIGNNKPVEIHLSDVFYVPDMGYNLLSIKRMTLDGWKVNFDDSTQCTISIKKSGQVLAIAHSKEGDLYRLKTLPMRLDNAAHISSTSSTASDIRDITPIKLWHDRLGHLNLGSMNLLSNQQLVQDFDIKSITKEADTQTVTQCEACIKGKAHRATMPSTATHRATTLLELVHSDVCGPMRSESIGGARYFVTFIDDYSRFTVVKVMKTKSEVLEHFTAYLNWAENITSHRIKVFRSDNGGEYCSNDFNSILIQHGISRQLTPPHTPEHNGVAERANRTIVECARSMLHGANLDYSYWGEAVVTAVYLRNRSPSRSVQNVTPFEAWTNEKPSISHLKTFGCKCYAHIPKQNRTKLEPKAKECIFVGYPSESKAYRVYDPVDKRLFVSRDVSFLENQTNHSSANYNDAAEIIVDVGGKDDSPSVIQVSSNDSTMNRSQVIPSVISSNNRSQVISSAINNIIPNDDSNHDEKKQFSSSNTSINNNESSGSNDSGRHIRNRGPVQPYWILKDQRPSSSALLTTDNSQFDNIHETNAELLYALVSANNINNEPVDLNDAMQRVDSKQWMQAAQEEYNSIIAAGTWELQPLPKGRTAIGCKWTLKQKFKANGDIDRYKARLCAKGYTQKSGIDYKETFAPVAKFASIRTLLAIAAFYDLEIHQMDVKTAFLNGDLEEDIYMIQPEGFVVKGKEHLYCKLKKALYGLKQASRAWYEKMDQALIDIGFNRLQADACVYMIRTKTVLTLISLYVDDLLLLSNCMSHLVHLKQNLSQKFEMKDLGEAEFLLGIQIERDRANRILYLSQETYIKKVIERFGMSDCKPVSTPLEAGMKLSKLDSPESDEMVNEMKKVPYQSAVGAIMYAMLGTRPDIAFAITALSQFSTNPGHLHWLALKRVLRYLRGTMDHKLTYGGSNICQHPLKLVSYCDSDWGSDIDDRRSISGYVFLLSGGAVSWKTKKQPTVAQSSVEAEYMAANQASREALWFRTLLNELGYFNLVSSPTKIYSDSQGSIALVKNPEFHTRTKHIDIQHHFVREHYINGAVDFQFVGTEDMIADVLTKPIAKVKHQKFVNLMGIKYIMCGSVGSH